MQDDKKTNNRNHSSLTRNFLWFIYKSFLIGMAVYLCYRCLHFFPSTFNLIEIFLCLLIVLCFTMIIKHYATAKKTAEQPDKLIIPSMPAVIGGILSWMIYIGFIIYGIRRLEVLLVSETLVNFAILAIGCITWFVVPKLIRFIIDPFNYLDNE